jgi:Predicted lipoprotein of unknown function (DUF2380)
MGIFFGLIARGVVGLLGALFSGTEPLNAPRDKNEVVQQSTAETAGRMVAGAGGGVLGGQLVGDTAGYLFGKKGKLSETEKDIASEQRPNSAEAKALPPAKVDDHHLFPRQYERYFAQKGIDIEKHTITVGKTNHLRGIHGNGLGNMPGRWNSEWGSFIRNNPNASAKDVYQKLGRMMDHYGLNDYNIHPYGE